MRPGLPLALGAGLQVSSQGAAATLVPAGTTANLRPTVVAQSPANHLDNVNRQLSVTWNLNLQKLQVFIGTQREGRKRYSQSSAKTNRSYRIRPKLPKTQSPQCRLPCLQVERQVIKQPGGTGTTHRPHSHSELAAPCQTLCLPALPSPWRSS